MAKIAFFDIDGVLSIPQYKIEGKMKPGGSDAWWKAYCKNESDPYKDCKVPKAIYKKALELKEQGTKLFVLSQENVQGAYEGKRKFVSEKYEGIFEEENILLVNENKDKCSLMVNIAAGMKTSLSEVYYVDDTFPLVLEASVLGIDAHHISEFLET